MKTYRDKKIYDYILIGFPRTGTTWIGRYFKFYNNNNLGEYFSIGELYKENIKFLNSEREKGNEYYIKYLSHQLQYLNEIAPGWHDDFYKNYTKIKLINTNVWRIFLSYFYQHDVFVKNGLLTNTRIWEKDYEVQKFSIHSKNKISEYDEIQRFVKRYVDYIRYNNYDLLWNIKDITHEFLVDFLELNLITTKKQSWFVHDYESKLLDDVEMLHDTLRYEFKKYGINYLQNGHIEL